MIDCIQCKVEKVPISLLKARDKALLEKQAFTWNDIDFVPEYANSRYIKKYIAEIKGIKIDLYDNTLKISNSLHKFFKGNNYSDFSYSEIIQSIDLMEDILQITASKMKPTKLEFGINEFFDDWQTILGSINHYKHKEFDKMKSKSKCYGKKLRMEQVYIKVYDKLEQVYLQNRERISPNMLRLEIGLLGKELSFIPNMEALKQFDILNKLKEKFLYYFDKIIFDEPYNLDKIENRDLELFFAGENPKFWTEYTKQNKEVAKKRKQKYSKIRKERVLPNLHKSVMDKATSKLNFLFRN